MQDVSFSHNAQRHRQTDRQHYHANSRSYCVLYNQLKATDESINLSDFQA